MKKDIHPKYEDAIVSCACGEVWHIKSTRPEVKVGICAKCHPFFTGKQKFVDTAVVSTNSTAATKKRNLRILQACRRQAFFLTT